MAKQSGKTSSAKATKAKTTKAKVSKAKTTKTRVTKAKTVKKTSAKKAATKKTTARKISKKVVDDRPKKKTTPKVSKLKPEELEAFRQLLLEKRHELTGDLNHMEAEVLKRNRQDSSGDLSSMPIHMADLGTDNYEQEFTLGLLQSEQQLLSDIDQALGRIETRQYGICVATGKTITKTRLKAKPWARYCIEYARMVEKGLAPAVDTQQ